jgi:serine/threonine-protein kinase
MSDALVKTAGLPSQITPGVIIGGRYRLEAEIGRGSMGIVFRASHVTLGQRVAIKLISSEHLQSLEARHRFSVEAKAAAKLRSRHVVQVYDDGETPEGNPYIVLELLEGETLEQRLERERDIPLADAVRITTHVGRALARAHAQGIVHRDLKPANIFLTKTEDDEQGFIAKVLDFGIAKLGESGDKSTTQAGTVLGTPLFMSPEQVRGASSVDHRADLYSLGMCLYQMLTGELAFYSQNYSEILIAICHQPLPRLRDAAPWVPEAIELWFQRACAKEPLERFQSADEMTEALVVAAGPAGAASKHQSVSEGRIAPETLVGYAPPNLELHATLIDTAASEAAPRLSRTQLIGAAPGASAEARRGVGTQVIEITASSPAARHAPDAISGRKPPFGDVHPLFVGAGFGLLSVAVVGLGLLVVRAMSSGAESPSSNVVPPTSAQTAPPPSAAAGPSQSESASLPAANAPAVPQPRASGRAETRSESAGGARSSGPRRAVPPAKSAKPATFLGGRPGGSAPKSGSPPSSDLGF